MRATCFALFSAILPLGGAIAQSQPTSAPVTEIIFRGETIHGGVEDPDGRVETVRGAERFGSLVRIRESFQAELVESGENL